MSHKYFMATFKEFLERKENEPLGLGDRNQWQSFSSNPLGNLLYHLGQHFKNVTPAQNVADITSKNRLQDYYGDKAAKTTEQFMSTIQPVLQAINLWDYARHIVRDWDSLYPRPQHSLEQWKMWLKHAEGELKNVVAPLYEKFPKAVRIHLLGYLDTYPLYLKNPRYPVNNKEGYKIAWNNDIGWEFKHITGIPN